MPHRVPVVHVGADPVPGAEVIHVIPVGCPWRIVAVTFTLTTDATAVNRVVSLVVDDGANVLFTTSPDSAQAASQTRRYSFFASARRGSGVNVTDYWAELPSDLVLVNPWRIRTVTTNLQPGDNYSAPVLLVVEEVY